MASKKMYFEEQNKRLTQEILKDTKLNEFVNSIKENYSVNLRDTLYD